MAHLPLLHLFQEHERDLRAFMAARLRCPATAHDLALAACLLLLALAPKRSLTLRADHRSGAEDPLGVILADGGSRRPASPTSSPPTARWW